MSTYKLRTYVNGVPIDLNKACPFCDEVDLMYPAYRNKDIATGLTQPEGPLNDEGLIEVSGIARPTTNVNPSGFLRPVPSGLERTYVKSFSDGTSIGREITTYYREGNWYETYWYCNTCKKFFVTPVPQESALPSGTNHGDMMHANGLDPFTQFV